MPDKFEILNQLKSISNDFSSIAIFWHVVIYFFILAILLRWRPSNRTVILFLALPALSVSILALISGNPFNGALFLIAFILIVLSGFKSTGEIIKLSSPFFLGSGVVLLIFGLLYPHFLEAESITEYLYKAPSGLIPCPTLSVIIGFALIFSRFKSKILSINLICLGLFYGFFGIIKLGVNLDIFLLSGTLILLFQYLTERKNLHK